MRRSAERDGKTRIEQHTFKTYGRRLTLQQNGSVSGVAFVVCVGV